jgi:hypothetical protein
MEKIKYRTRCDPIIACEFRKLIILAAGKKGQKTLESWRTTAIMQNPVTAKLVNAYNSKFSTLSKFTPHKFRITNAAMVYSDKYPGGNHEQTEILYMVESADNTLNHKYPGSGENYVAIKHVKFEEQAIFQEAQVDGIEESKENDTPIDLASESDSDAAVRELRLSIEKRKLDIQEMELEKLLKKRK